MPIYEYACPDCGHEFEQSQKFTDAPVKRCPTCGKRKVYRVVSKVAVAFKGSGWYITDSKSTDSTKHTAKKAKPAETKPGESTPQVAPEAKPAAPAESKSDASGSSASDAKTDSKSDKK